MPQVDIKINSLADLKGFLDTTRAAKDTRKETESLGSFLKQGLGVGSGIELARRGFELFKETVIESVRQAFDLAVKIKDGAESLGISRQAYQVLGEVMRDVGGEQERMTQAIAANNRSLVEARSLVGPAAAAYRTLGLDPVQLEGLSVQRRLQAIGQAVDQTTDKTEAFSAAGQILGSKNLPVLLNALRLLGTEGYDSLAEKAEKAGRVMSDDTVDRLDHAQKAIDKWKRSLVIGVGESIAVIDQLQASLRKDFKLTIVAALSAPALGNFSVLKKVLDQNSPEAKKETPAGEDPAVLAANQASAAARVKQLTSIRDAELELTKVKLGQQEIDANSRLTDFEKGRLTKSNLADEFFARRKIIELLQSSKLEDNETPQQRAAKLAQLEAENQILLTRSTIIARGGRPAAVSIAEKATRVEDPRENPNFLSAGQGAAAGLEEYVSSIGSLGEQVAAGINDSVGGAVSNITAGIYGWITGTETFGATLRNIGSSILQSMLQTLIQMGTQQLINAVIGKTAMASVEAFSDAQRTARVVKNNAAEIAELPAKTAGAAAAGISSYGVALAFGAIAIGLILAAMGGFEDGGYTPGGPSNKLVGGVHAGEWVSPQWMVNHPVYGPVIAALEGARNGIGNFLEGGLVDPVSALTQPGFAPAAVGAAGEQGTAAGAQGMNVAMFDDRSAMKQWMQSNDGHTVILDIIGKNRHVFGI